LNAGQSVGGAPMGFVHLIELTTQQPDEVEALAARWKEQTAGRRKAIRSTVAGDRDRPDTYVVIVEFNSYDEAMANSALPETGAFAEEMAALCDGPLLFRNLDVRRVDDLLT
jgi:hypothetical protein